MHLQLAQTASWKQGFCHRNAVNLTFYAFFRRHICFIMLMSYLSVSTFPFHQETEVPTAASGVYHIATRFGGESDMIATH